MELLYSEMNHKTMSTEKLYGGSIFFEGRFYDILVAYDEDIMLEIILKDNENHEPSFKILVTEYFKPLNYGIFSPLLALDLVKVVKSEIDKCNTLDEQIKEIIEKP